MDRWVIVYEHRFGNDIFFIDAPEGVEVTEDDVLATLPEIDWDLDREDEWVNIYRMSDEDVSTLVKAA
jgi:hypothetical protein